MSKPLTLMVRVLAILSVTIVQAQPNVNNSMLCYISTDNTSHKVDIGLSKAHPFTINCNYSDAQAAIPKYIQFACNGGSTLLSADIYVTNGSETQKISQEIHLLADKKQYEVPVLAYVNNDIMQNGKARISAITFTNTINVATQLTEVNFSNTSNDYEVKLNQIFTVEVNKGQQKNYIIKANTLKDVSISLYKSTGEFNQKVSKTLTGGDNYLLFDDLYLQDGKYVVVITENKSNSLNNAKITGMF